MKDTLKLFFVFLFLCIFKQGWGQCDISSITVTQAKTGNAVEGQPEYEVDVNNNCVCSQTNLKLRCTGFSSTENVDPAVFKPIDGQDCLVNDGQPIFQNSPIKFKYAWKTPFDLPPVDSQINCS